MDTILFRPQCRAMLIGSFPFMDPGPTVELILDHTPD